jgi:deoxyribodipyrimidine photo-lyase
METCLFIFRRDLRLIDNTALIEASKKYKNIIPIFIFTNEQVKNNEFKSNKAIHFMIESLLELNKDIKNKNGKLNCFYGKNINILKNILKNEKIDGVIVNKDYTPYSKERDAKIEELCKENNINFHSYHDVCLFEPKSIKTGSGKVYEKFTPFYNKCLENLKKINKVSRKTISNISNKKLKNSVSLKSMLKELVKSNEKQLIGGRNEGLKKINDLKNYEKYKDTRNFLNIETTQLSVYLKFGCISIREVYEKLLKLYNKENDIIRQLIWRDFYIHILDANPQVLKGKSLKEKYDKIKWKNNKDWFKKWSNGETGFPVVDACMRELNETGYMHNRGRLIVASFLIKNLLIDWRWGEKYFATKLVDYDPAANNGNWQWVAGSGADSQPYFRIFNPWSQSEKHDPQAKYIKKWIPKLENVDVKDIHNWNEKYDKYKNIDYPKPMVDYSKMRTKALELYKKYL